MKNDFFGVDDFSGTVDRKGVGTVDRGEDRDMVDVTENDESHQKKGINRCFHQSFLTPISTSAVCTKLDVRT